MSREWIKQRALGYFIPMAQFGRDHWSTFAYLETCAVDNGGEVNRDRMRCNPELHPGLTGRYAREITEPFRHPTRLKDGLAEDHDDWNCFEDLEAAGLVKWLGSGAYPLVELTVKGHAVAAILRKHKANGGSFRQFEYKEDL